MKLVWQYFALTVTWRILIIKLEYSRHVVVLEYINILIYLLQPGSSPNLGSNWNLFSVFWEVDFLAALKITKNTSEIEIWSRKIHSRISNVETRKPVSSGVGDFQGDWTFFGGFWIYFGFEWKLGAGSVFFIFFQNRKSPVLGVTSLYNHGYRHGYLPTENTVLVASNCQIYIVPSNSFVPSILNGTVNQLRLRSSWLTSFLHLLRCNMNDNIMHHGHWLHAEHECCHSQLWIARAIEFLLRLQRGNCCIARRSSPSLLSVLSNNNI